MARDLAVIKLDLQAAKAGKLTESLRRLEKELETIVKLGGGDAVEAESVRNEAEQARLRIERNPGFGTSMGFGM